MPPEARKLLENVSLGVAAEVAALRAKRAGVIVEPSTNQKDKSVPHTRVPKILLESLVKTKDPSKV